METGPIMTLDFDGVWHEYVTKMSKWDPTKILDGPTPGAEAAIQSYLTHFNVQVFSSRSHQHGGREAMQAWVVKNHGWDIANQIGFPLVKPPALIGLDDRVLTFTGTWPTLDELLAFRPWNKR